MSFSIDTNILIYSVNQASENHLKAKSFIEKIAQSSEAWFMPWPVVHSFIRLTTHSRIMASPLSLLQAIEVINVLFSRPNIELITETDTFWPVIRKELLLGHFRGALVSDVVLSTMLKEHGVRLFYSADRDFLRFKHLRVVNPLE